MFSCCRANPKNSKKSKKLNEDSTTNSKDDQITEPNDISSTNDNNKKLIIPTITIENGKTVTTDNCSNNEFIDGNNVEESVNKIIEKISENENIITTEINEESLAETETVIVQPVIIEAATTADTLAETDYSTRITETNGINYFLFANYYKYKIIFI